MNLDADQIAAIGSTAKTTVCLAGPGSGKSRTLVARVKMRLAQGVDPKEIYVLTFTNAGAHVFAERLAPVKLGYMGTVHGLCFRLIQQYGHFVGYRPGSVSIVTETAQKNLLEEVRRKLGKKISDKEMMAGATPAALLIWKEYRHQVKRANMVDYDQILIDGHALLRVDDVRKHISPIREMLGDELQDSGPADWNVIFALPADSFFLVGDTDQSIYSFRGGDPAIFLHAATLCGENVSRHGGVELVASSQEFPLKLNYRSDVDICAAATKLIEHNVNRLDKPVVPVSTEPGFVGLQEYHHEGEEIYGVWGQICDLMKEGEGCNYDDIAVLTRTNSLAEKFRETLRGLGMPIKSNGRVRLPADWSFALTCLSVMIDQNNDFHVEELMRGRGTPKDMIRNWKLHALASGRSLHAVSKMPDLKASNLMEALGYLTLLGVGEESRRLIAQRVEVLPNEHSTVSDLLADLWRTDTWTVQDDGVGVVVSTIHAAKGMEWDIVFIVAAEEGVLPLTRKNDDLDEAEVIEEERRLAFVAITRARHQLFVSYALQRMAYYKVLNQQPSRFIREMGL